MGQYNSLDEREVATKQVSEEVVRENIFNVYGLYILPLVGIYLSYDSLQGLSISNKQIYREMKKIDKDNIFWSRRFEETFSIRIPTVMLQRNIWKEVYLYLSKEKKIGYKNVYYRNNSPSNSDIDVVKLALLLGTDPSIQDNEAMIYACKIGSLGLVQILLEDDRVDPSAQNNEAICFAAQNGHLNIVDLLLKDNRVDPSTQNNRPLIIAAKKGHSDIVKLLLNNNRVDSSEYYCTVAIAYGVQNGHLEVVKIFKDNKFLYSSQLGNLALILAAELGHTDILKLFLEDKRLDPCADNSAAILKAVSQNKFDVIRLLIKDKRVDPSIENNAVLLHSVQSGKIDIVKQLLEHERVLAVMFSEQGVFNSVRNNIAIFRAKVNGYDETADLFEGKLYEMKNS